MTTPGSNGPGEQPPGGGSGWGPPAGSPQPGSQQPGSVPPPPPGQYPPPQGQFSPGEYPGQYPPQGPGQYPAQGQYPPGQYPPGQGFPPQQPAAKKGGAGKWIAIVGGILAVVVIGLLAFVFLAGGDPKAGDCLQQDGQELSVVGCDDSAAAWKLIGIQEGKQTYDEYFADPETCSAFPEAVQSFWVGENDDQTGDGVVYCVAEN